jgi:hypothetical protein
MNAGSLTGSRALNLTPVSPETANTRARASVSEILGHLESLVLSSSAVLRASLT